MEQRQPTDLWAETRRLLGFLRSLLARLFPAARPAPMPPTAQPFANQPSLHQRRAFVTANDAFQPAPLSRNGHTHQPPPPSQQEDRLAAIPAPDGEVGDGDEMEMQGVEEVIVDTFPLLSTLESLLFVADEPVEATRLAQALRCSVADVQSALAQLRMEYESHNRGVRLQERNGKVQLVTNPAAAQAVEDFLSLELTTKLSGPALETLAIVAYRQPVTRVQIEAVRGVDCSGMVRKLEQQGLVEEMGRLETPGRPILYGVTDLFMQHFGLTRLEELPALPEVDADSLRAVMALAEE